MDYKSGTKYVGQQIEHVVCFHATNMVKACALSSGISSTNIEESTQAFFHYAMTFHRINTMIRQSIDGAR